MDNIYRAVNTAKVNENVYQFLKTAKVNGQ